MYNARRIPIPVPGSARSRFSTPVDASGASGEPTGEPPAVVRSRVGEVRRIRGAGPLRAGEIRRRMYIHDPPGKPFVVLESADGCTLAQRISAFHCTGTRQSLYVGCPRFGSRTGLLGVLAVIGSSEQVISLGQLSLFERNDEPTDLPVRVGHDAAALVLLPWAVAATDREVVSQPVTIAYQAL